MCSEDVRFGKIAGVLIRGCARFAAEMHGICPIPRKKRKYDSIVYAIREGLHVAKDLLSRERDIVVQVARTALTRTIEQYSPPGTDVLAIAAVAVSGMFADLISGLPANSELVEAVNRQIEQSGYRLVGTRRH